MANPNCRWVRDRLPLLVGDELLVVDRRRVERHLIGCPECRQRRTALGLALETLHVAAAESPTQTEAPSLWPAVARQIRESRRPAAGPFPAWPWFNMRPALGFSLGFGLLAAVAVALAARHELNVARGRIAANARPIPPAARVAVLEEPAPSPVPAAEAPSPSSEVPVREAAAPTKLRFDLDHGTPMGSDLREGKQPTY
jgi:anti-sigma factor RsiW